MPRTPVQACNREIDKRVSQRWSRDELVSKGFVVPYANAYEGRLELACSEDMPVGRADLESHDIDVPPERLYLVRIVGARRAARSAQATRARTATATRARSSRRCLHRGHAPGLRALIPAIEPEIAADTLRLRGLVRALDGYAAWHRGEKTRALEVLREASISTSGGGDLYRAVITERNQVIRAWIGKMLLDMDRPREALVYYESVGPGWPFGQDPMIYFQLGRIRELIGDTQGAREAYELAAMAWQNPDPEMETLARTARSEAARWQNEAVN